MLSILLPLISLTVGILPPGPGEMTVTPDGTEEPPLSPRAIEAIETPRVAQVRLAETLIDADAIRSVTAHGTRVSFVIEDAGLALDVVATLGRRGEIIALEIVPSSRERSPAAIAPADLSWLGVELADVVAITRLVVDRRGQVTLITRTDEDDIPTERSYRAIAKRAGGNTAVEARWTAAWDGERS